MGGVRMIEGGTRGFVGEAGVGGAGDVESQENSHPSGLTTVHPYLYDT